MFLSDLALMSHNNFCFFFLNNIFFHRFNFFILIFYFILFYFFYFYFYFFIFFLLAAMRHHIPVVTSPVFKLIVTNMLGFAGSGFFKSLKVFQIICRTLQKNFENAKWDVSDVVLVFLLLILNIICTFF